MEISLKCSCTENFFEVLEVRIGSLNSETWPNTVSSNQFIEVMDINEFVSLINNSLKYSDILSKISTEQ